MADVGGNMQNAAASGVRCGVWRKRGIVRRSRLRLSIAGAFLEGCPHLSLLFPVECFGDGADFAF